MTICILLFVRTNTNQQLDWAKLINVQLEKATKVDTEHYEDTKKRLEEPAPTKTALTK